MHACTIFESRGNETAKQAGGQLAPLNGAPDRRFFWVGAFMQRSEQIVRLSEFLDRHRGQLMSLPGVTNVGVGPRTLRDADGDVVVQIFVGSRDQADSVRERASEILNPGEMEVFVRGNLEPLRG